jgi:hypothetical protein
MGKYISTHIGLIPETSRTRHWGQSLFGSGVKLRPGQNIEYIITESESVVPNDRVRAFALWEGWFGYDRKKYGAMLREAFQPFELFIAQPPPKDFWRITQKYRKKESLVT